MVIAEGDRLFARRYTRQEVIVGAKDSVGPAIGCAVDILLPDSVTRMLIQQSSPPDTGGNVTSGDQEYPADFPVQPIDELEDVTDANPCGWTGGNLQEFRIKRQGDVYEQLELQLTNESNINQSTDSPVNRK